MKEFWTVFTIAFVVTVAVLLGTKSALPSTDLLLKAQEAKCLELAVKRAKETNKNLEQQLRVTFLLHHIYLYTDGRVGSPKMQKALEAMFENDDTVTVDKLLQETKFEAIEAWEKRTGRKLEH